MYIDAGYCSIAEVAIYIHKEDGAPVHWDRRGMHIHTCDKGGALCITKDDIYIYIYIHTGGERYSMQRKIGHTYMYN